MREVRDRVRAQEDWSDYDIEWVVDCLEPIEVSQRLGILRSVLMEVVENALIHGLADDRQGQIVLRALRKETRCYIQIQDLGRGISAENLGQVLEPFFTTERGRGRIGLGLTEVFNLIAFQLGGTLSIDGSEEAAVSCPLSCQPRFSRLVKLGFTPIIELYLGPHLKVTKNGVVAKVVSK